MEGQLPRGIQPTVHYYRELARMPSHLRQETDPRARASQDADGRQSIPFAYNVTGSPDSFTDWCATFFSFDCLPLKLIHFLPVSTAQHPEAPLPRETLALDPPCSYRGVRHSWPRSSCWCWIRGLQVLSQEEGGTGSIAVGEELFSTALSSLKASVRL